jgi:hypothetical protein
MAHELFASQLIWNCLTAKEERFADEREVRGIIMNVRRSLIRGGGHTPSPANSNQSRLNNEHLSAIPSR